MCPHCLFIVVSLEGLRICNLSDFPSPIIQMCNGISFFKCIAIRPFFFFFGEGVVCRYSFMNTSFVRISLVCIKIIELLSAQV